LLIATNYHEENSTYRTKCLPKTRDFTIWISTIFPVACHNRLFTALRRDQHGITGDFSGRFSHKDQMGDRLNPPGRGKARDPDDPFCFRRGRHDPLNAGHRGIATPLFVRHLKNFLEEYAELGAIRFVERLRESYRAMVENMATFEEIAPARRRSVKGKILTVREYVLDSGARDFLVLYWVPPEPSEPVLLLNIRIGGQNRIRWKDESQ
jgi:hypothetical protein